MRGRVFALLPALALTLTLWAPAALAGGPGGGPGGPPPAGGPTAGTVTEPSAEPVAEPTAEPSAVPTQEVNAQPTAQVSDQPAVESSAEEESVQPVESPAESARVTVTLPPIREGTGEEDGEEGERSLADKLFLPLILVSVALVAVVVWLLYDRRKKGGPKAAESSVTGSAPRDVVVPGTVPPTMDPGKTPAYRVGNLHNIGRRGEQQDSFCLSDVRDETALRDKGLMAVVADGMGGLEGGAAISQLVTDTFRGRYAQYAIPDPDAFLYETARTAEETVEDYMKRTGTDGGSTLVCVLLRGNKLHFLSVGDSRIYLLRGGDLIQLNHEHTFGALLKEKAARGEVDPEEPYVNPRRDALVAYIGMGTFNTVDRSGKPVLLAPGDKVLLCSDGVFNALGSDAMVTAMAGDALTAAQTLEEAVLAQGLTNQDNFTGIIIEYAGEE